MMKVCYDLFLVTHVALAIVSEMCPNLTEFFLTSYNTCVVTWSGIRYMFQRLNKLKRLNIVQLEVPKCHYISGEDSEFYQTLSESCPELEELYIVAGPKRAPLSKFSKMK